MTQELLYTSAAQGLNPGSRGFCTVVRTRGMPGPLAALLESLSGYRPAFAPNDPRASQNPVNYSHVRAAVGGKTLSILSRVADYGLDYSQRTNKIAHHVVLAADERPEAGPAWLLAQPGFMDARWDGQPRTLPTGRRVPQGTERPTLCPTWAALMGDAGWAGVLAESWLAGTPCYLIFEPGTNTLGLIREAVALLPPRKRWEATFATYFTGIPSGVGCNCRCVVDGSQEAIQALRLPNVLSIPLNRKLPRASGGALVEAARSGNSQAAAVGNSAQGGTTSKSHPPTLPQSASISTGGSGSGSRSPDSSASYALRKTAAEPPPMRVRQATPGEVDPETRRRRWIWWLSGSLVSVLILAIGGFVGFRLIQPQREKSAPVAEGKPIPAGQKVAEADKGPDKGGAPRDKAKKAPETQSPKEARRPIEVAASQKPPNSTGQSKDDVAVGAHKTPDVKGPPSVDSPTKADVANAKPTGKTTEAGPKADLHPSAPHVAKDVAAASWPPQAASSLRNRSDSQSVLELPELKRGQLQDRAWRVELAKNAKYSATLMIPAEYKLSLSVSPTDRGFALEQRMTRSELVLTAVLEPSSEALQFKFAGGGNRSPDPSPEELRDFLRLSQIVLRPKDHPADSITRQFIESHLPSIKATPRAAAHATTRGSTKSKRKPIAQADSPGMMWRVKLPIRVSKLGPDVYMEGVTLRFADKNLPFIANAKPNKVVFPNGNLPLTSAPFSDDLVKLAVGDQLEALKLKDDLEKIGPLMSARFEKEGTNSSTFSFIDVIVEPERLRDFRIAVDSAHFDRLRHLLKEAFGEQWVHDAAKELQSPDPVLKKIERGKAEAEKLSEKEQQEPRRLDGVLKEFEKLHSQAKQTQDYFEKFANAPIVRGRMYYKVKDGSEPDAKPTEMDLVRIEDTGANVTGSQR